MKIDIVIPVHNALSYLQHCVETVMACTPDYRLIFVDDFSDKTTAEYLYNLVDANPTFLLVRSGKQRWFTRASNLGLRMVRTELAILLNSDCEVNHGWTEELIGVYDEFARENPAIGLVGHAGVPDADRRYVTTQYPNYVTGHCLLLNMKAMAHMAAARGTPGWYFNETDPEQVHIASDRIACYDLNRLGYQTLVSFKAAVGHVGGRSWDYDLRAVGVAASKMHHLD